MCSISGFCFTPDSHINPTKLAAALLVAGESRGEDACGYSYFTQDATIVTKTRATTPTLFTRKGFKIPSSARTAVLHTRFATQGTPDNPLNNHPIERYTADRQVVSLVHNGVLDNDNALFASYGYERFAQVDSEALPALVADHKPGDVPTAFLDVIGAYACGYLDERMPHTLTMLRGNSSPLLVAEISASPRSKTPRSNIEGVIFASTRKMLEAGLNAIGMSLSSKRVRDYIVSEGQYLSVTAGVWDNFVYPFTVAKRWSSRQWDTNLTTSAIPASQSLWSDYEAGNDTGLGWGDDHVIKPRYGRYNPESDEAQADNLMLHMEWCEPAFCVLGHPTGCPVNEDRLGVMGYEPHADAPRPRNQRSTAPGRRGSANPLGMPSDADIEAVVKAWTGKSSPK